MDPFFSSHTIFDIPHYRLINPEKIAFQRPDYLSFEREEVLRLLSSVLGFKGLIELKHQRNGAPFLDCFPDIKLSISHCKSAVSVLLSKSYPFVGIDIEEISERPLRVRQKFMTREELLMFDSEDDNFCGDKQRMRIATVIWSAKEALYKAYSSHIPTLQLNNIRCNEDLSNRELNLKQESSLSFQIEVDNHKFDSMVEVKLIDSNLLIAYILA